MFPESSGWASLLQRSCQGLPLLPGKADPHSHCPESPASPPTPNLASWNLIATLCLLGCPPSTYQTFIPMPGSHQGGHSILQCLQSPALAWELETKMGQLQSCPMWLHWLPSVGLTPPWITPSPPPGSPPLCFSLLLPRQTVVRSLLQSWPSPHSSLAPSWARTWCSSQPGMGWPCPQ